LVGLKKTGSKNSLDNIDEAMGAIGPWDSLSGSKDCPSWGSDLDGSGRWGTCSDYRLISAFYREPGTTGDLSSISDCKCKSPTPKQPFYDCYE